MTEDRMIGWHHQHEFKWAPGVGEGQGSLACYSLWSWGRKELGMTE